MLSTLRLPLIAILLSLFAASCTVPADNTDPDHQVDDTVVPPTPEDVSNLLTDKDYRKIVFNIAVSEGTSFSYRATGNIYGFLNGRISKSILQFRIIDVPSIGKPTVTVDDLKTFEKKYKTKDTDGDTIFVWVPVVDAVFSPDPKPDIVLGVAYGPTSMAIFGKKLDEYTLPDMVSRFTLETFVFEHEFCHLLGMTNNGLNMVTPHQDMAHGNHCSNPGCLMYWRAHDNVKLVDILDNSGTSDAIPFLDANCLADLKAGGGK